MSFFGFRDLWSTALRRSYAKFIQKCYRRPLNGHTTRRFKLFIKSSVFCTALRYGLLDSKSLSLSTTIISSDDDSDAVSSQLLSSKKNESAQESSSNHSDFKKEQLNSHVESNNVNWEHVYEDKNIKVFRRCRSDIGGIYEYKCTGTYNDITPISFVETQNDLDYRRQWDDNVISLEVVKDDEDSGAQVINWVARYPYPMYAREYVFLRRKHVDDRTQTITVESEAVDTRGHSSEKKYVRVSCYHSMLVVRSHTTLNQKGLDYILTYYDDPKSSIPTMAYNWIVNQGGPHFMKKIYKAALERDSMNDSTKDDELNLNKRQHQTHKNDISNADGNHITRPDANAGRE